MIKCKPFQIVCDYKSVKIRSYGDKFCIVYEKKNGKELKVCKTITSAKCWITCNKIFIKASVTLTNGCNIDLVGYTKFY